MSNVAAASDLIDEIAARGSITAKDVSLLRRDLFADGVVQPSEADAVFRLNEHCRSRGSAWAEFFVDSLTDYLVWQATPAKYVDEAKARLLIANIVHNGRVESATELELLINVIYWAESCPEELVLFALEAVRDSVLDPDHAAYGAGRRPGVIDAVDVEIIRRVIYPMASDGGFTVTRREAELLFALNKATDEANNDGAWADLFVKGVANYLMFPRPAPHVPSASERSRRDAWLRERRGVGLLLMDVGRAFGSFDFAAAWREIDLFGKRRARAAAAREAADAAMAEVRQAIDEPEARWLIERLDEDGELSENERSLLRFIACHATSIHPLLEERLTRAGI